METSRSEQDYTDLMDELRSFEQAHRVQSRPFAGVGRPDHEEQAERYKRAADAIEALVKERDDERATRKANNGLARRVVEALRARPGWVEPDKTPEGFGSMNFADVVLREVGRIERERDELAAVIEKAQQAGRVTGYSRHKEPVMKALDTAPAEALREHDAALIESLADHLNRNFQSIPAWNEAYRKGVRTDEWMSAAIRMTMSVVCWLHERARQVREGEA